MKLPFRANLPPERAINTASRRGILLVECMVYLGLFTVVIGLAMAAFYHCQTASDLLRRNAQDIALALRAGERWRGDARLAAAPPRFETEGAVQVFIIPQSGGAETLYAFVNREVLVKTAAQPAWTTLLKGVKASAMSVEKRETTLACRWELELESKQKTVRLPPLFTFVTAPQNIAPPAAP